MNKKYGCYYDDERIWKIETAAEGDNIVFFNNVCPKLIVSEIMQHCDYFNSNYSLFGKVLILFETRCARKNKDALDFNILYFFYYFFSSL